MAKVKTSVSLERSTLRRLKVEAKRHKRSVSQLVDIWIEERLPSANNKSAAAPEQDLLPV
jgi:predicted DNA-binding ribbon-helix-helix protein